MTRRWTARDISLTRCTVAGEGSASAAPASLPRRTRSARPARTLEDRLAAELALVGAGPVFEREARFHPTRRWRFDFFSRAYSLAIEVHGGSFIRDSETGEVTSGRHTRGAGFRADRIKMNAAAELGITVLEFTDWHLEKGRGITQVLRILETRSWKTTNECLIRHTS